MPHPRERAAKCIEHDHPAPAESCTCGSRATVDLSELLAAVTGRTFTGDSASILAATGVLARVLLEGRILIGVGMPADDPPTTWRAARARVLELHLAPHLAEHADALAARYNVPVAAYDPDEWPSRVAQLSELRGSPAVGSSSRSGRSAPGSAPRQAAFA